MKHDEKDSKSAQVQGGIATPQQANPRMRDTKETNIALLSRLLRGTKDRFASSQKLKKESGRTLKNKKPKTKKLKGNRNRTTLKETKLCSPYMRKWVWGMPDWHCAGTSSDQLPLIISNS